MRGIHILTIAVLAVTACDKFGGGSGSDIPPPDPSLLTSSGEVELADGNSMSFNITSERYKQWDAARRAFPKSLITRFGQVLQPRAPTERSINSAVALLESNAAARRAIEDAGLSVRGFVETTVALEQQMMVASTRGARPEPVPTYDTYPMTMDSGYYPMPAQPYPPVTPYPAPSPYPTPTPYPSPTPYPAPVLPAPRDTVRRDTVMPAPTPTPVPAPTPTPVPPTPLPLPRPDTVPTRRDTVVPRPAPRDTSVDTMRVVLPPDSLPRR